MYETIDSTPLGIPGKVLIWTLTELPLRTWDLMTKVHHGQLPTTSYGSMIHIYSSRRWSPTLNSKANLTLSRIQRRWSASISGLHVRILGTETSSECFSDHKVHHSLWTDRVIINHPENKGHSSCLLFWGVHNNLRRTHWCHTSRVWREVWRRKGAEMEWVCLCIFWVSWKLTSYLIDWDHGQNKYGGSIYKLFPSHPLTGDWRWWNQVGPILNHTGNHKPFKGQYIWLDTQDTVCREHSLGIY